MHTPSSKAIFDVAIAGGGFIGTLAAIALGQLGLKIILIDAGPLSSKPTDYRAIAITKKSEEYFKKLGIWEIIAPHMHPLNDIITMDRTISPPPQLAFTDTLGPGVPLAHMINASMLKSHLHAMAGAFKNIHWVQNFSMDSIHYEQTLVSLSTANETISARLLLGCDGVHSFVRKNALLPTLERDYKQQALVTAYKFEEGPPSIAFEFILSKSILAILPLANNQCSIVWTCDAEYAHRLLSLSDSDFDQELASHIPLFQSLKRIAPLRSYPLFAQWVPKFVKPRMALLGDAAHSVHPLAGLGVNLGIQDVGCLEAQLRRSLNLGLDIGALSELKDYEHARRWPHAKIFGATDRLNALFTSAVLGTSWLRRQSISFTQKSPILKEILLGST